MNSVMTPNAHAETNMTRAENTTDSSLPRPETENMFPERATSVIPIMRMDHSSSGLVTNPSRNRQQVPLVLSPP